MAKKAVARNTSGKTGSQGKAKGFQQKSQDVDAAWNQSKNAEPTSGGFAIADIPDGDYIGQLTGARTGHYKSGKKKGMMYFRFTHTIKFGEHAGTKVSRSDDVDSSKEIVIGGVTTNPLNLLSVALQKMGVNTKLIKSITKEGPAVCQAMLKDQPINRLTVKTRPATPKDDGTVGQPFQSVYINDSVSDDELDALKKQFGE